MKKYKSFFIVVLILIVVDAATIVFLNTRKTSTDQNSSQAEKSNVITETAYAEVLSTIPGNEVRASVSTGFVDLKTGDKLNEGSQIQTFSGPAYIKFQTGDIITIGNNSDIKIVSFKDNQIVLDQIKGLVYHEHTSQAGYKVMVDGAEISPTGTEFSVDVVENDAVVKVFDGNVDFKVKDVESDEHEVQKLEVGEKITFAKKEKRTTKDKVKDVAELNKVESEALEKKSDIKSEFEKRIKEMTIVVLSRNKILGSTESMPFLLEGKIRNNVTSLKINDTNAEIVAVNHPEFNNFKFPTTLKTGENKYSIIATDTTGKTNTKEISLNYKIREKKKQEASVTSLVSTQTPTPTKIETQKEVNFLIDTVTKMDGGKYKVCWINKPESSGAKIVYALASVSANPEITKNSYASLTAEAIKSNCGIFYPTKGIETTLRICAYQAATDSCAMYSNTYKFVP